MPTCCRVGSRAQMLSSAALKWIALAAMTLDHIAFFLPLPAPVSAFLHLIGRISAPIFFFLMAEAVAHTHSRRRYLMRLYLACCGMKLCALACRALPLSGGRTVSQNIFETLFLAALLGLLFRELCCAPSGRFQGDSPPVRRRRAALLLLLFLAATLLLPPALALLPSGPARALLSALLPSLRATEGGPLFVLLGAGLVLLRDDRTSALLFLALFSLLFLLPGMNHTQAFMLCSVPLLLCYSGKRGRYPRSFFYLYYPIHLFFLLFLSVFLQ